MTHDFDLQLLPNMPDIPVSARILLMTAPRGPMSFPILSWGTTTDPILLVTSLASCSRSSSATTIRLEGKLKYVHNMPKTKQRLGSQSGSTATAFIHESDMLATKDMTTAHYQSNILTQADPQADRDIDAQTDVALPARCQGGCHHLERHTSLLQGLHMKASDAFVCANKLQQQHADDPGNRADSPFTG
ncbi:MAG: hypothetical protein FRX49_05764 [Trebouxia sp. A1-2]|nr:MAG: hypothetical protein FRX49_05764 [Trebouxia sp. A1-2]